MLNMTKTKIHDHKFVVNGEYGYAIFEINKDCEIVLTFADGKKYVSYPYRELTYPRTRSTTIEKYVGEFYHKVKNTYYSDGVPRN